MCMVGGGPAGENVSAISDGESCCRSEAELVGGEFSLLGSMPRRRLYGPVRDRAAKGCRPAEPGPARRCCRGARRLMTAGTGTMKAMSGSRRRRDPRAPRGRIIGERTVSVPSRRIRANARIEAVVIVLLGWPSLDSRRTRTRVGSRAVTSAKRSPALIVLAVASEVSRGPSGE